MRLHLTKKPPNRNLGSIYYSLYLSTRDPYYLNSYKENIKLEKKQPRLSSWPCFSSVLPHLSHHFLYWVYLGEQHGLQSAATTWINIFEFDDARKGKMFNRHRHNMLIVGTMHKQSTFTKTLGQR